jgi:hypothetical protein
VYYVRAGVRDSVVAAALGPLLRKAAERKKNDGESNTKGMKIGSDGAHWSKSTHGAAALLRPASASRGYQLSTRTRCDVVQRCR